MARAYAKAVRYYGSPLCPAAGASHLRLLRSYSRPAAQLLQASPVQARLPLHSRRPRPPQRLSPRSSSHHRRRSAKPLFFLDKLATSACIALTDVNTTSMPLTQMPLALANKAVDAAMGVEPFITIAEQQHSAKLVLPSGAFAPGVPNFVLQMSPIFAS